MKPKSKIASFFNALFVELRHFNIFKKIEGVVEKMNVSEKIFFSIASTVCVLSGLILLVEVHNSFLVEVPSFGGSFVEGVVGSPRFINPVLALSDTDKDLTSLVYSGLMRYSESGDLEADMADSYEISQDGTVYKVKIKDNQYFHDGKKVTADDVVFTINKIIDPVIKSPKKAAWEGITVEKAADDEVIFTLKKPYTPFLSALTLGILPKHIWENVSSEEFPFSGFNIDPVGSGPYKVDKISKNSGAIPTSITLSAWNKYSLGRPQIKKIVFKFFQNENDLAKAYSEKTVESAAGLSPAAAKRLEGEKNKIEGHSLPRVFGVFFNQNVAPVLANKEVRAALDMAAPKKRVVNEVLSGFGSVLKGPLPSSIETDPEKALGNIEAAKAFLIDKGWKENKDGILEKKSKSGAELLSFSISTSDTPELKKTAEILQEAWQKMGAKVEIKVFEAGDLSQNIIKSRKYDALLFGEVVAEDTDMYPFWHSSERNDPGLNISLYANITVDKELAEIQTEADPQKRSDDKKIVLSEIEKDVPAVFLFSPYFLYAPAPQIKNVILKDISSQNERFLSINKWFIETDKVLSFFAKH